MPLFQVRLIDERTIKQALPKEALRSFWYRSLTRAVSHCVPAASALVIAVVYVDRERIQMLNKKYRGIAQKTDVLSYGYTDGMGMLEEGEIIICPDVVLARRQRFPTKDVQEFARLFFHGLLHIYGYDHVQASERSAMRAREECLMKRSKPFINNP